MFDTHLHSCFSTDSAMKIQEAIAAARSVGNKIIFTEHMDLDYPGEPGAFEFNVNDYFKEYNGFRNAKVLLGIEIGMQPSAHRRNAQIAQNNPFDYVIGSIHIVDNVDIYRKEYYALRTKQETYQRYLEVMRDCVKAYDDFDSLGHIDYISRYAAYDEPEIWIEDYPELIDEILELIIQKEKVIEINTRRLDNPNSVEALTKIYKRYKELGGKYVTIGSDAHRASEIGRRILMAWEFAETLGLQPVYFKERQMKVDNR